MSSRPRLLAGLLALMVAGTGCLGGRSVGDTSALIVGSLVGEVRARDTASDAWRTLEKGERVSVGARIQVPAKGSIVLKRGDVSSVQLVPYDVQPAEMQIDSVSAIEMITGDMLVRSNKQAPIAVSSQGVSATPTPSKGVETPIFRFDRRVSIRVGVYTGQASVSALDGTLPIPTLKEGVVAARELPPAATPLTVDPNDPFDKQLLIDVINLDVDLASDSRGYEAAYGTRMKSWREIARIAPGRDLGFTTTFLPNRGSADILIGVVFALLYETRGPGNPPAAQWFPTFMSLLDQGATWGLLAREFLGADQLSAFRDAVTRAIALRTGEIKSSVGAVPSATPTANPTTTPSTTPTSRPTTTPSSSPTSTPTTTPIPTPSPTCTFILFPVPC